MELLAQARREAESQYPDVRVDDERLAAFLAGKGGAHLADLVLAAACCAGDAAALAHLQDLAEGVDRALETIDPTPTFAADVRSVLLERLLVGATPKLAAYRGEGTLQSWLRTAAMRIALNLKRKSHPEPMSDALLASVVDATGDVELEVLRKRHRADFDAAFKDGLASLSSQERNVLRLHLLAGLSIDRIAEMYGTHRATAARWVVKSKELLLQRTREHLAQRLSLSPAELSSLLRVAASGLDISVRRLLEAAG